MKVLVEGIEQGAIEIELGLLSRLGESIRVFYGPDAEVEGVVEGVHHVINQHDGGHKIILKIKPTF
ncbi:hypothetical protein [Acinetobacter soli]|uniref:hypothetical protein n=1 Tax=Acinetobacter soli TaxID=487316 RepID=UPI002FF310FB